MQWEQPSMSLRQKDRYEGVDRPVYFLDWNRRGVEGGGTFCSARVMGGSGEGQEGVNARRFINVPPSHSLRLPTRPASNGPW